MKKAEYKEPKSLLEVREWKRKVSNHIERLGWTEFHKQSEKRCKELMDHIEAHRQEKLAAKR